METEILANGFTDKKYTETVRMKFSGQTKQKIFGKLYTYSLSKIDRSANFLGIINCNRYIQNRYSIEIYQSFDIC